MDGSGKAAPIATPPVPPNRKRVSPDVRRLFATRIARLFAYGSLSVILALYLAELGFTETQIGLLLTLTLVGDTAISLWITMITDRVGRRRMLVFGAGLMILAGVLFALTRNFALLLFAATVGVLSPSGNEVGPFLAIEQAALSEIVPSERRVHVFAWYNMVGSFATAAGALAAGGLVQGLGAAGFSSISAYRSVVCAYAAIGLVLALIFARVSTAVEPPAGTAGRAAVPSLVPSLRLGTRSRSVILRLSALFSLDAFAGGFVIQSMVAYWFHLQFGVEPAILGSIFFGANLLAGASSLLAAKVAQRFGLINTMVFTHLPSNILLILVPLMPNLPLAIAVLLLRFSISQMDVPTRQAYTMAVVAPEERSAAAGITGVARTTGASLAPVLTGRLLATPSLLGAPFFIAGGLKIIYDLLLYRSFRSAQTAEESDEHIESRAQ